MTKERKVSLRRSLEQTGHCIAEALSVIEADEDVRCAIDDLEQAKLLLEKCLGDARRAYARSQGDV